MLEHWVWLAARTGMSNRNKLSVLQHFRDPEDVYYGAAADYIPVDGLTEDGLESLMDKDLGPAQAVLEACRRAEVSFLTYGDAHYPARLKQIPDPPLVLYCKGKLPEFSGGPIIGVVGTRKASVYGLNMAKRMGYQIAKCGGVVVSGMAYGIDSAAIKGAMTAGQMVVGVLGCGVDQVYPASNRALFADVVQCGCLLSEYPPGTPPYKWNFPQRNRIISGMADGVLVVEAPEKSGALITARQAADQGRDVFVVPGNIDVATCAGSNALLRDGAMAVCSGWDVVSEYQELYPDKIHKDLSPAPQMAVPEMRGAQVAQIPMVPRNREPVQQVNDKKVIDKKEMPPYSDGNNCCPRLSETEQRMIALLGSNERLVDEIVAEAGLPAGRALAALTTLQVKGIVTLLPGGRVKSKTIYCSEEIHGKTI